LRSDELLQQALCSSALPAERLSALQPCAMMARLPIAGAATWEWLPPDIMYA
jgi:hypothetical protein